MLSAKKIFMAIAASSLAVTPVLAQSQITSKSATKLSLDRAAAKAKKDSEFVGIPVAVLIIGAAAIIGGVIVIADDDDEPVSP